MTDNQQVAFEAWYATHDPRTPQSPFDRELACKAWQAALASLEVQAMRLDLEQYVSIASELATENEALRKDAERLNWLAEQDAQIQSLALANGTRYRLGWPDDGEAQSEWFKCPREAIDHARRIEGDGE